MHFILDFIAALNVLFPCICAQTCEENYFNGNLL